MDLENEINRVFNPEIKPLVKEAFKCYSSGVPRAAIVLVWTAVCADLISKMQTLKESGEGEANAISNKVEKAQSPQEQDSVKLMLEVEREILDVAEKLELIDFTQGQQLARIREDRNLCAHPSMRPLGEHYEPSVEYARAHLVAALDSVLTHPPIQGRKVVQKFGEHVVDAEFDLDIDYIEYAFFDRVRSSTRAKIVDFAAKFAVLEVDSEGALEPELLAERMSMCFKRFAERDHETAKASVRKLVGRFENAPSSLKLRTLARLGGLSSFREAIPQNLIEHFDGLISGIGSSGRDKKLLKQEVEILCLVADPGCRADMPALEEAFSSLPVGARARIVSKRPDAYFAPFLHLLLREARNFDEGEFIAGSAVLPCASYLSPSQFKSVLDEWDGNNQCWGRKMGDYLVLLFAEVVDKGQEYEDVATSFVADVAGDRYIHIFGSERVEKADDDAAGSK